MKESLIIGISGVRGIIGGNLTPIIAAEYGCALGTFLKNNVQLKKEKLPVVCIGRDSRPSGDMLKSAVAAGLCSIGINITDLGIVTTPTVGIMVRDLKCAAGVVITASHNPARYNGIKVLLWNGMAPPPQVAEEIKKCFLEKKYSFVDSLSCGKVTFNEQANNIHIDKALSITNKDIITSKRFRVVLDSVNGAGGPITKKLLGELGCEVVAINNEPTGLFAHMPEPLAENLTGLCEAVKTNNAQIGFAQDPDADRLVVVDEKGNYIGEEYTLVLAAKSVLGKSAGKLATNLSTSRMIDDTAKQLGAEVIRTAVGEVNVANAMVEHNCVIGGEGNGGVIDLRVGPVRDSLVGIVLILQLMAETGKTISSLVGDIPPYYMRKQKFAVKTEDVKHILDRTKKTFAEAKIDTTDGCRFDFDDGWLHIRPSNTEPVIRVIAEAENESAVRKYISMVYSILSRFS
ncbi:MAG: phosphoglucosamine mutase [Sedimentisphaerales bacterium]|nr:phosphoglucosamine mutase [Sedimentisphaerales bacterium]